MAKKEAKMEWHGECCNNHAKFKGAFALIGGLLFLALGLGYLQTRWETLVGLGMLVIGLKKLAWSMK